MGYSDVQYQVISDPEQKEAIKRMSVRPTNSGRKPAAIMMALVAGEMVSIPTNGMSHKQINRMKFGLRNRTNYAGRRGYRIRTRSDEGTLYVWAEKEAAPNPFISSTDQS